MAVRKRNGVWYADFRYMDPKTGKSTRLKRSTGPGTTKKEALELERRWRRELEAPSPETQIIKRAAFSGFAKHFLDTHIKPNRKHSYYRTTEQTLRVHLVPYFGDRDLRDVDPEDVARYKALKVQALAPKTVNNHLGVLSVLFRKAVEWGYTEVNPVTGAGLLRLPPQEMQFWDREQSNAFLDAVLETDPSWYPFFLCALRTGMRLGELIALRWANIDYVKAQLRVMWSYSHGALTSPKNHRSRVIPMSGQLARALRAHRHLRGPLVFCREDGSYLTRDIVKHPFDRAIAKAGVEAIRIHDLRHSFASQLVMDGTPLTAVKELLGHSTLDMTMRYSHLSPSAKASYVNQLDGDADESWSHSGPTEDVSSNDGGENPA